jgi:hypothetical protein
MPSLLPQPANARTHAAAAVTQSGAILSFKLNMKAFLRFDKLRVSSHNQQTGKRDTQYGQIID